MKLARNRFPKNLGTFSRLRHPMQCSKPKWARKKMDASLIEHRWTERDAKCLDQLRPSRLQAEEAVRTLIRWAGDDPGREGLIDTPERVVRAYEEWFAGYHDDPAQLLERCFEEIAGYDEIVLLRDIRFESHCEHHMA